MKKYLILLLFPLLFVGCAKSEEATNNNDNLNVKIDGFSIELSQDKGGWSFNTYKVTVDEYGNYKYIDDDTRIDEVDEIIEGKLSDTELEELIDYIVFEKKFFRIPEESDQVIFDARITTTVLNYDGETHTVIGVSLENKDFDAINNRLKEYKDNF